MLIGSILLNIFFLSILVQAAKRAKQFKSILNRVCPTDPEYLLMITQSKKEKKSNEYRINK